MSNNDGIRYCHRCSYIFLKFILFVYAIVFWVSATVVVARADRAAGFVRAGL